MEQDTPLTPYLICDRAADAIAYYVTVFGARELFRLCEPSGKVGHAELQFGGSRIMLADEYPDFGAVSPNTVGGSPVSLHLYVEDVDGVVARAVEAGATVLRPVSDESFGDRSGVIRDPFGHKWQLATRLEEVTPDEMQRRWSEELAKGA